MLCFRYNPSLLSNYDTSGSYYNLMTESKHNVQEPKVVEMPLNEIIKEEVRKVSIREAIKNAM